MSRRFLILAVSLTALGLVAAPTAGAAKMKLGGGSTTLKLKPAIASALGDAGVKVRPVKPAAVNGGGLAFPITGGTVDSATARGQIHHSGGLALSAGGTKVKLTSFTVRDRQARRIAEREGGQCPHPGADARSQQREGPAFGPRAERDRRAGGSDRHRRGRAEQGVRRVAVLARARDRDGRA